MGPTLVVPQPFRGEQFSDNCAADMTKAIDMLAGRCFTGNFTVIFAETGGMQKKKVVLHSLRADQRNSTLALTRKPVMSSSTDARRKRDLVRRYRFVRN